MIDDKIMTNLQGLSRLKLAPEEAHNLAGQLEDIIEYFEVLSSFDTKGVDVDLGIELKPGDLREDLADTGVDRKTIESFAVDFDNGFFVVPRILGDETDA